MPHIHDLRERPHRAEPVAERIWKAFWKHHGTPFAPVRRGGGLGVSRLYLVSRPALRDFYVGLG